MRAGGWGESSLAGTVNLRNFFLDLISIHELRVITRCPMDFNFPSTISLGAVPSRVLGYNSLPREKCFDTISRTPSIFNTV